MKLEIQNLKTIEIVKRRKKIEGRGNGKYSQVVAGVKHLIVCMKETGTKRSDTLPSTMLRQVRAATGMMRMILSRLDCTTISGFKRNTCEQKQRLALRSCSLQSHFHLCVFNKEHLETSTDSSSYDTHQL